MKNKLFLAILPALLVLASCSAVQPKVEAEPFFKEDTLAHEEVFEQDESGLISSLVRKAVDPVVDPSVPSIGIQSHEENNSISIRFVGAITLDEQNAASTTAVWTRTMYNAIGDAVKATTQMPCKTAYTALKDGDSVLTIAEFNAFRSTTYTHFVVYTMLDIPDTYEGWYLNAFLTVNGVASKTVSTTVDQSIQTTFDSSYTYFLRGTIGGVQQDLPQWPTLLGDNSNDHASFKGTFNANDSFVVVANTPSYYKIYDLSYDRLLEGGMTGWKNYAFSDDNGKIKINYQADYIFYLNDQDYMYFSIDNVVRPLYVSLKDVSWWTDNSAWTAIYAFNDTTNVSRWYKTSASGNYLVSSAPIDPTIYDQVIVVRMNSASSSKTEEQLSWDDKFYNQTKDLTILDNELKDCVYVSDTDLGENKKDASWGTR